LKNPKLNEHPVDHETPLKMVVVLFQPTFRGCLCVEKLKNPTPQKEQHEDLVNEKEGFFGGISKKNEMRW